MPLPSFEFLSSRPVKVAALGLTALLLVSCHGRQSDPMEYRLDGTATQQFYEGTHDEDGAPIEGGKGNLVFSTIHSCEPQSQTGIVQRFGPDGQEIVEERYTHPTSACEDNRITDGESVYDD